MGEILAARLQTRYEFPPGEELMLALGVALGDLGAIPAAAMRRGGLSHTQYNILRILRGAGEAGLLHGEIAERLVVGAPDVTRSIDRLERRRLVRRERATDDRRKVVHTLTASGRRLLGKIQPDLDAFHDWLAGELPEADRRTFVRLCERLIALAERGRGTGGAS